MKVQDEKFTLSGVERNPGSTTLKEKTNSIAVWSFSFKGFPSPSGGSPEGEGGIEG